MGRVRGLRCLLVAMIVAAVLFALSAGSVARAVSSGGSVSDAASAPDTVSAAAIAAAYGHRVEVTGLDVVGVRRTGPGWHRRTAELLVA